MSLEWEDCCGFYYVSASIATGGGGYWPCMVNLDVELEGSITSGDARELAAVLVRAADACDEATTREMLA